MRTTELKFDSCGSANEKSIVLCGNARFTVLTPCLLRLEYDANRLFEDRPTLTVLNRKFELPEFTVVEKSGGVEISTSAFHLVYDGCGFSPEHLYIDAKNNYTNYGARWRFGETVYGDPPRHHNLFGTARTLDKLDGSRPLDFGLMSRSGHSFFDDSKALLLDENGRPAERSDGIIDVYYFCYGKDYFATLRDFFRLCGKPPMLPRYALGNWWSRYWEYTAESYTALVDRFADNRLPFSVAVVDMDWHLTKIPERYGKGWTGFTWNRELFPDPPKFLDGLHRRGMHIALNLHPADGIQGYEDSYRAMAVEMGVDPKSDAPVNFDFADGKFIDAYFDKIIRPQEQNGVDFWWIDWQQGKTCRLPGLDPMWALNHYHYLDNNRDSSKRGLILSRYTGFGSHRYPAGFSGDTITTWASLAFQPYFTVTAVNAGYPWWSHDIGGFKAGIRDSELFIRWLQFGVFSIFNRLHSSNSQFTSKDPDSFEPTARPMIAELLRLRYRLIPYLYTAVSGANLELKPPLYPVYYRYPNTAAAYNVPNQYFLGDELMVCPITSPSDPDTKLGSVTAWIPNGCWTDLFTGHTYRGGRSMVLCRPTEQIPVLVKPGGIVPLAKCTDKANSTSNPDELEVVICPGGSNVYRLFEDSGDGNGYLAGAYAVTEFTLDCNESSIFTVKTTGDLSVLPENRRFTLLFRGFSEFTPKTALPHTVTYDRKTRTVAVTFDALPTGTEITVDITGALEDKHEDIAERVFEFLNYARLPEVLKTQLNCIYKVKKPEGVIATSIAALNPPKAVGNALFELSFS